MGRAKKYFTEEERKGAEREYNRRYRERHREELRGRWRKNSRKYYKKNREKCKAAAREKYRQNNRKLKYKEFTKEAQGRPLAGTAGLSAKQKAILQRIATAVTADDIE